MERRSEFSLIPAFFCWVSLFASAIISKGCANSIFMPSFFQTEFEETISQFGIDMSFHYQKDEYMSGRYAEGIVTALKKRKRVYDVLSQFRSQEPTDEERENYYPISIYCTSCGKDDTHVKQLSEDCITLDYACKCGNEETLDLTKGGSFKLPWKVDWPMRWKSEKVDFEPGGKDHATQGGSYFVAKRICEVIYEYPAPIFQGYEFVGLTGTSKMSGSSGMAITPRELLKIYQPEMILWFFAKYSPTKAFNICLNDEILRQYDEFDRAITAFYEERASDQVRRNMEMSTVQGRKPIPVPFRQLAGFSTIFQGNHEALEEMFERIGTPFKKEEFEERLEKAENWLKQYSPENVINLREAPDNEYYAKLSFEEKKWVNRLKDELAEKEMSFEELTVLLYAIPKKDDVEDKVNKAKQRKFFGIIYKLLIGKDTGPRLATFIKALNPERFLHLISFS